MRYRDEEIVTLRMNYKKRNYINSLTGMYLGDELLQFSKLELFAGFSAMLPEIFSKMEQDMAVKKYPSVNRPQVIFTNESGTVNFTFSLYDKASSNGTVEGALEQFKLIIRAMQPSSHFMGDGSGEGKTGCFGWSSFRSSSLDGNVYNMMSLIDLEDKFLLGMFNCAEAEWMLWRPFMVEVLHTIHREEEGE